MEESEGARRRSADVRVRGRMVAVGRGILGLLLALDGVSAMTPVWPNGAPRATVAGAIEVPGGPRVLLGFRGSYGGLRDVVPGDKISIIQSTKSCIMNADLAQGASAGGVLGFVTLDENRTAFFNFENLQPNAGYQVCVCPLWEQTNGECPDGAGKADSLSITVKKVILGLKYKNVIGGFVAVPAQSCGAACPAAFSNEVAHYESVPYENLFPTKLSLISLDGDCASVGASAANAAAPDASSSATRSGHLTCGAPPARTISGFGAVNSMAPGFYKVCIEQGGVWQSTGVVVAVQASVSHLVVNAIPSVLAFSPRVAAQQLRVCRTHDCAAPWGSGDAVSFIPLSASCADSGTANPRERTGTASGHITPRSTGDLDRAEVDKVTSVSGIYRMCVRVGAQGAFQFSGIHLVVQVNLISKKPL